MYYNEENKRIILFEGEYLNGKRWNGLEKNLRVLVYIMKVNIYKEKNFQ